MNPHEEIGALTGQVKLLTRQLEEYTSPKSFDPHTTIGVYEWDDAHIHFAYEFMKGEPGDGINPPEHAAVDIVAVYINGVWLDPSFVNPITISDAERHFLIVEQE